MSLAVDLHARVGSFDLQAAFAVEPGEVLAVLGPNGSGKSTLLGAIAGHLSGVTGRLALGGDPIAASVPPEKRRIGFLGQNAMLFPHLSALENVAFGPRAQGVSASVARDRAAAHLAELGLEGLMSHRPAQLSGGQQQRVAMARALAAEPRALLLDEPFASLDAETGTQARKIILQLRDRLAIPMVVVTHDPLDAMLLAAQTIVIDSGRIVQQGATGEVLGHPRTRFAAAIVGVNLVTGAGTGTGALHAADTLVLEGRGDRLREGEKGSAVFAPPAVRISADPPVGGTAANSWHGTVSVMEAAPGGVRLFTAEHPELAVDCPSGFAAALSIRPGTVLSFTVDADDVSVRRDG